MRVQKNVGLPLIITEVNYKCSGLQGCFFSDDGLVFSPGEERAQMTPSSCRCSRATLTEGPSSLTARLCLESSLSISSSPNSTRDKWDATGLDGRVAAWERAGERSGELKALPISDAVSVLSLLGVGEGCEADVMQMPPVRPSVRTDRGVFRASFL